MVQVDCPEVGAQEGAGEDNSCCLNGSREDMVFFGKEEMVGFWP